MSKQIDKAKALLNQPSKIKKVKFVSTDENKISLNERLIEKTSKLLGIKGYYTDLEETTADNTTIIKHYHELYKIEHAFRISKNDLQTRPIFHFKEQPIKLHLLICFMALVLSKHIENKTEMSIRAFIDKCKKVTHGRLLNKINRKEIVMKPQIPGELTEIINKIIKPH